MKVKDCETLLIGSLKELLKNREYFYNSTVGSDYCHLTDKGQQLLLETIQIFGPRLLKAMEQEDDERSKQLVMQTLKGEKQ